MEGEPILKKTLVTVAAMVGACVVFVGTLSLVAVLVVTRAAGGSSGASIGNGDKAETSGPAAPPGAAPKTGASPAKATHEQI